MKASDLITSAENTLLDPSNQYWKADELLGYINEAQRQIAHLKPDAATRTIDHVLVAGARQAIPDDGLLLIDVIRNMGVADDATRPAITPVDQRLMDRMVPAWQQTENKTVEHFMYDERDRTTFYVYPAQPSNPGTVELRYVARPDELTDSDQSLAIGDAYFSVVLDYTLYRAHSKSTQAAVPARAQAHYQMFAQQLGLYEQAAQADTAGAPARDGGLR